MKLIGKNSVSKYISYFFAALFFLVLLSGVYELLGWIISYYNFSTGNTLLSQLFETGKDVGWNKNQWTNKMDDLEKFKFYIPFTESNFRTGVFSLSTFIGNTFSNLFLITFTYFSFRVFREFSKENFFNQKTIQFLKGFAWFCIIFFIGNTVINLFIVKYFGTSLIYGFWHFILGIMILFVTEFFKKGYELQSENDLTI
ncbi:MAG: DUF2975 domain-containing protein [Cloacibacterium sp.]|nr:DUF2975 domain-containing protein [Cloacibacterium sp.]